MAGAAAGGSSTTAPGGTGGGSGAGGTATTQPGGASGSTTTTRAPFPVKMRVEKPCVRRGATTGDVQAVIVETRPEDTVAYSTEYSDQSNEISKPEYKTGSGYGVADDKGNYRGEWRVPDTATEGMAKLHVIADGRIHSTLTFRVVSQTGKC
jgi:hypothetical protein